MEHPQKARGAVADPGREDGSAGAPPRVSVVIPTLNGASDIGGVLAAVCRQSLAGTLEILVVDSGSTDATLDIVDQHPVRLFHVERDAFDHGDTRNLAISRARAPFVVILSQDAEPRGDHWLETLVRPLEADEKVAAVCGRLLPRPGMDLLLRRMVEGDLNFSRERRVVSVASPAALEALSPYEKRLHVNFHDVGSCIRRSLWQRLPLPRTRFGEDLMWARSVLENGFKLVYEPEAEVYHAHEYAVRSLYRRGWWDGWMNRRLLDRFPVQRFHHIFIHTWRGVVGDMKFLSTHGFSGLDCLRTLARSVRLQLAVFAGLYRGARRTEYGPVARTLTPDRPFRILFVVHGFPPQDLAGTEVYTLTTATALKNHGHDVAVFHRYAAPDAPEYRLETGDYEGLRTYKLVNNFRYDGIGETFENRHVEDRFREVLAREQPDLVHFQHCLHTSVSLISLCEDRGIPTVVTLNDYWFICPTVQLILPDRSLCRVKQGGLICIRCARNQGKRKRAVRLARVVVQCLGPLANLGPAVYSRLLARFPRLRRDAFEDAVALCRRPEAILRHLRRAGRVLSPSRFLRRRYLEFGLDPEKILYQRYGIRTARLRGEAKVPGQGPLRVGFIGSFVWYKGLHVLLEAFQGIPPTTAVLKVYGNPDAPAQVRPYGETCRRLAEGAPVQFEGPLAQADLCEAHRNLDVLVVPSLWYENSPLVILEAMAAGTPVVASDLGGMAEMVVEGETGFLFPRGDPVALRRRILALGAEPSRVEDMRRNLRPPKDIDTNLAELELLYRQEISRVRPHGGRVPFWSAAGKRYDRAQGGVEIQGEDMALLRPQSNHPSSISFDLEMARPGPVRFEVTTRLLATEPDVVLSGGLFVNESWIGEIPPHCAAEGASLSRCHRFGLECRSGRVTLTLTNASGMDEVASGTLRVQRVAAFHESSESLT